MGLDLVTYWDELTPNRYKALLEAYIQKEKNRAKEIDLFNYYLGRYVMHAFHDPKKYPKKPFLQESELSKEMSSSDMAARARMITRALGGTIIKNKK